MLKYVNYGIVFQEIPDEVTLSINISNCPCKCPGCHSKYLWQDIGEPLTSKTIDIFMEKYGNDITCICFMGGDIMPEEVEYLSKLIHRNFSDIKVGWYSGRSNIDPNIDINNFDYIKTGPYIEHLGALNNKSTNQRLYKKKDNNKFEDITSKFWKK